MRIFPGLVMFSAICFAGVASARDTPEFTTTDVQVIVAQQLNLRDLVESEVGRFDSMSSSERSELLDRQSGLLESLDGYDDIQDLALDDRIDVFNDLQWIRATVNNQPAKEIVVCQQRRRTGSHIRSVDCMTAGQAQRMREAADAFFRNGMVGNNFPAGGGF